MERKGFAVTVTVLMSIALMFGVVGCGGSTTNTSSSSPIGTLQAQTKVYETNVMKLEGWYRPVSATLVVKDARGTRNIDAVFKEYDPENYRGGGKWYMVKEGTNEPAYDRAPQSFDDVYLSDGEFIGVMGISSRIVLFEGQYRLYGASFLRVNPSNGDLIMYRIPGVKYNDGAQLIGYLEFPDGTSTGVSEVVFKKIN